MSQSVIGEVLLPLADHQVNYLGPTQAVHICQIVRDPGVLPLVNQLEQRNNKNHTLALHVDGSLNTMFWVLEY